MHQLFDCKSFKFFTNLEITSLLAALSLTLGSLASFGQKNAATPLHVDPPHWFIGMPSPELDILIHSENIGDAKIEIGSGNQRVKLVKVLPMANPNYALVQLNLAEAKAADSFTIAIKGRGKREKYTYQLKDRTVCKRGLDQSDLIYLITPDRFANGDPANDSFKDMKQVGVNRQEPFKRHGGDIQGIIDHLDYIQNLGVTAIWPNPLLENDQPLESYHGYAFTDYYQIDRRFGSNALYKTLVDSLHARGMKMIMDVVYNHMGSEHYLYRDMPDSAWFHIWPEYTRTSYRATTLMDPYASAHDKKIMTDGWFDKHMPDLDQTNADVARYLIQQTLWWIEEYQLDGLRIDTYAYPDQAFMRRWGKTVKEAFPDIFLFAETWVHGTPVQAWFLGDALAPEPNHLDGLTDFQVYYAINEALHNQQGWTEGISKLYYTLAADYVYKHPEKMVTFLDNHDLARFLGSMNGDMAKFEIGLSLLFTLRGIPSIYYGTELLMKETDGHGKIREDMMGGWANDSINKFMVAGRSQAENDAYDLIKTLSDFRRAHPALTEGSFTQYVPIDGLYVYFRKKGDDLIMVAINTGTKERSAPMSKFSEFISGAKRLVTPDGSMSINKENLVLPAMSVRIWSVE